MKKHIIILLSVAICSGLALSIFFNYQRLHLRYELRQVHDPNEFHEALAAIGRSSLPLKQILDEVILLCLSSNQARQEIGFQVLNHVVTGAWQIEGELTDDELLSFHEMYFSEQADSPNADRRALAERVLKAIPRIRHTNALLHGDLSARHPERH